MLLLIGLHIPHPVFGDIRRAIREGAALGNNALMKLLHVGQPREHILSGNRLNAQPHPFVLRQAHGTERLEDAILVNRFDLVHDSIIPLDGIPFSSFSMLRLLAQDQRFGFTGEVAGYLVRGSGTPVNRRFGPPVKSRPGSFCSWAKRTNSH